MVSVRMRCHVYGNRRLWCWFLLCGIHCVCLRHCSVYTPMYKTRRNQKDRKEGHTCLANRFTAHDRKTELCFCSNKTLNKFMPVLCLAAQQSWEPEHLDGCAPFLVLLLYNKSVGLLAGCQLCRALVSKNLWLSFLMVWPHRILLSNVDLQFHHSSPLSLLHFSIPPDTIQGKDKKEGHRVRSYKHHILTQENGRKSPFCERLIKRSIVQNNLPCPKQVAQAMV